MAAARQAGLTAGGPPKRGSHARGASRSEMLRDFRPAANSGPPATAFLPRSGRPADVLVGPLFASTQLKLTFGATRFSGDSISSSCAGQKANMPAMIVLGNTSRVLL